MNFLLPVLMSLTAVQSLPKRGLDRVLPDKAVEIVLSCVCQTHPNKRACYEDRRQDVAQKAKELIEVTERVPGIPDFMRPFLLAVACGEGGFRNRPTCGGDPGCNDTGTSGGMFQIKLKGSLSKAYERLYGKTLDTHDHKEAGRYYLQRLIMGVERFVPGSCGIRGRSKREVWNIAAFRLGRGPTLYWTDKSCHPKLDWDGEKFAIAYTCKDPKPVPRCEASSKYAKWAVNWHRRCPDCWRLR